MAQVSKKQVKAIIFAKRLSVSDEGAMQAAIEERLLAAGVDFEREMRLPGDAGRIDFFLTLEDGIRLGIECKVKAGGGNTARQLLRYAMSNEFDELVLITSRGYRLQTDSFASGERDIPVSVWQCPI